MFEKIKKTPPKVLKQDLLKTSRNKGISYKNRMQRQKQAKIYEHTLIQNETYVFEGQMKNGLKHGEGVMLFKNGMCIIGHWVNDYLHGRILLFPPFGGKASVPFDSGKINGWMILSYGPIIMCTLYYQNKIDGEKFIYDNSEKLWVSCSYTANNKFDSIINAERGQRMNLPSFVNSVQLQELFDEYICQGIKYVSQNCLIKQFQIGNSVYIGFALENKPQGLGVVFTAQETFMGKYNQGLLEEYGRMIFQNGHIYHGGFCNGAFHGEGVSYNPNLNKSIIACLERDKQTILCEMEGYVHVQLHFNLGILRGGKSGIIGQSVVEICNIVENYYYRFHIQPHNKNNDSVDNQFNTSEPFLNEGNELRNTQNFDQEKTKNKQNKIKWLKTRQGTYDELNLANESNLSSFKRNRSLNKREAEQIRQSSQQLQKIKNENDYNYETTQVKENIYPEEAENYKLKIPISTSGPKLIDALEKKTLKSVTSDDILKPQKREEQFSQMIGVLNKSKFKKDEVNNQHEYNKNAGKMINGTSSKRCKIFL